jgi:hypothetical protein
MSNIWTDTHLHLALTRLYTSFFAENIGSPFLFTIKRNEAGNVLIDIPFKTDAQIPIISASDIGKWALVAFKNPDEWIGEHITLSLLISQFLNSFSPIGKDLKVVTEWRTTREIAKIIEEELGEKVVLKEVDDEQWKASKTGIPNFEEVWLNLQYFDDIYPHGAGRDIELSNKLVPNAGTVRDRVRALGQKLIAA